MDNLSAVSETALITLKARIAESEKSKPVIEDEVASVCFNRLRPLLPDQLRNRLTDRALPLTLTRYIALRARKYDRRTAQFLKDNTDGLVVSLGCGFDTRYWRVAKEPWKYIEIDLPNVIELKKKVLGDLATYTMIGCSVLEEGWIEKVLSVQKEHVLFLAEGLFMYLPKDGVMNLFRRLSQSFSRSEIMFEAVNEKYTKGLWKRMVMSKMGTLGTQAGSSYNFGIRDARDIEAYADNIRVMEEWSYLEDEAVAPGILRSLRSFRLLSRTQWTIRAAIG